MIKFNVFYTNYHPQQKRLSYITEDYAFNAEPHVRFIDFDIAINYLCLTVLNKKIIEVSGFCPYGAWIKTSLRHRITNPEDWKC